MVRWAVVGVAWWLVTAVAWAAGPLTAQEVDRFVQSYAELKPIFDADDPGEAGAGEDPAALAAGWGKTLARDATAQAVLTRHGLDLARWTDLASRVLTAYMVLKMSEGGGSPAAQLRRSLAELEKDTSIPASMKPEMMANYRQAIAQYEAMERSVSEADKAAVRSRLPQLDAVLEWTDQ